MVSLIEPEGVEVLYYTTSSCGHKWAKELLKVSETISLTKLASLGPGSEIFGNLAGYSHRHKLSTLTRMDVLRYFVTDHPKDANRSANFKPAENGETNNLFGRMLANCAIWPLEEDGSLKLGKKLVRVSGAKEIGGKGFLFLHRRATFRLAVTEEERSELKELLSANKLFLAALVLVGNELSLPIITTEPK